MHSDLVVTLMIFGSITFANVKLHPPSSIIRSAIDQAMIRLFFEPKEDKLGGGMGLWGAN